MPMIANYYAQVGINIDTAGAVKVQRYLDGIKKQLTSFQKTVSRTMDIPLRVKIDTKRSMAGINREIRAISGMTNLTIRNLNFSKTEAVKNLNRVLSGSHGRTNIRVGALLSQESLRGMREQLRSSINSLTVSPTIRPNVRQTVIRGSGGGTVREGRRATGGTMLDPHNTRRMSPWHNPMMIGGGAGAFLRYGAFSLPFVGGVMGLNSLTNSTERVQNAYLGLRAQVADNTLAREQLEFLKALGGNHGIRVTDMVPGYSQMFAAAQGSPLQDYMKQGFQNFIQYGSVIGMNEEQKKGAILALSQIVGKGGKGFAQELNLQLVNQGMPNARRLFAEAVAGGDQARFEKMMANGEVGLEGVRKFLELLGKRAQPYLEEYYGTVTAQKGRVGFQTEQYLKNFLDSGGSEGLAQVFRTLEQIIADSIPHAEMFGQAFERISYFSSGLMLLPGELKKWADGIEDSRNYFEIHFGKFSERGGLQDVIKSFRALNETIAQLDTNILPSMSSTFKELDFLLRGINSVLRSIIGVSDTTRVFKNEGIKAGAEYVVENNDVDRARNIALRQLKERGGDYSQAELENRTSQIFAAIQANRRDSPVPHWMQGSDMTSRPWWAGRNYIPLPGTPENPILPSIDPSQYPMNGPIQTTDMFSRIPGQISGPIELVISGNVTVEPGEVFSSEFSTAVKDQTQQSLYDMLRGVPSNSVSSTPQ